MEINNNKLNALLIIILLFLLMLIFRYCYTLKWPPIVGGFDPDMYRRVIYIHKHHHMFKDKLPGYTYASNVGNVAGFFPVDYLFVILVEILGYSRYERLIQLSIILPIQTMLLIPLFSIIFYKFLTKVYGGHPNVKDYILLWAFTSSGLPYLTSFAGVFTRNALYSWAFVILSFYLLFRSYEKNDKKWKLLLALFLILIIVFKFTVGLLFITLFFVIIILIFSYFIGKRKYDMIKKWGTITIPSFLLSLVVFLFRYGYEIPYRLQGMLREIKRILTLFNLDLFSHRIMIKRLSVNDWSYWLCFVKDLLSPFDKLANNFLRNIQRILLHTPSLLVASMFIALCIYLVYKKRCEDIYSLTIFFSLFSLPLFVIGFYLWGGLWAVYYRVSQIYSILSILSLAYILASFEAARNRKNWNIYTMPTKKLTRFFQTKGRSILMIFTGICIGTSSYIAVTAQPNFSYGEYMGIKWCGNNINPHSPVFSDFRIGPSLTFYNFTKIVTINSVEYPITFKNMYKELFLNISEKNLEHGISIINQKKKFIPQYMVFSQKMMVYGIYTAIEIFKPPGKDFLKGYDALPILNKIYSSNEIYIYRL